MKIVLMAAMMLGVHGGCDGSETNSWDPHWASSPDEACALWAGHNKDWGALANGQTLAEACQRTFARDESDRCWLKPQTSPALAG